MPGETFLNLVTIADELSHIQQAQEARFGGATIHDMPSTITGIFADYGLYTTTEPYRPEPNNFREFRRNVRNAEMLRRNAHNVRDAMLSVPQYRSLPALGYLGSYFSLVFGHVTAISAENVHIIDRVYEDDQLVDGTVVAESMTFDVPSYAAGARLNDAFQILLHAPNQTYPVRQMYEQDRHRVQVLGVNEHMVRAIGRAVGALVAEQDEVKGIVLPEDKRRLGFWKRTGRTFPQDLDRRLTNAAENYQALENNVSATYVGRPDLRPVTERGLLATDAAPAFQGMRNIFNAMIRAEFRDGSTRNQEQDPNVGRRLSIERGVELTRDPSTAADLAEGPASSRALYSFEKFREAGLRALSDTKRHPVRTAAKFIAQVLGAGVESLVDVAIDVAPHATNSSAQALRDYKAWRQHKEHIAASGRRMDTILRDALMQGMITQERLRSQPRKTL